ncbi:sulfonate ABC transporter substrate-binding protein [Amycolatopsis sp. WAC 04197]|uniref:ABC transporter substrate-binding protein n=1 Tax=Amycolatopsis sp. WAC 04197 TaxID=2203199 RepID=UPI000F7AFB19|nr:ABC transporter substrate-binding protein [Amycolatopsis sp. WAC 04197]RSN39687.1 sulfonate ABC transporter substrate-binding protein [Amycolatopsis sp. WAC 04197]
MSSSKGKELFERVEKRTGAVLAAVLLLVTPLSACSAFSEPESPAPEKAKITVAALPTIDLAPLWLAQEGGHFEAEGLQVNLKPLNSAQPPYDDMNTGKVDIVLSSYVPFILSSSTRTQNIKLVADGSSTDKYSSAVVTVPGSPVQRVLDLPGKRVAVVGTNTIAQLLTRSVMVDHGLDDDKVEWVEMRLEDVAAALTEKRVDAAYLSEPFLTQALLSSRASVVAGLSTGSSVDFPLTGYAATNDWVTGNPNTLAAFRRAMAAASRDIVDRSKFEPIVVNHLKVSTDAAALMSLPTFGAVVNPQRLQRVSDLLQTMQVTAERFDVNPIIAR